DRARRDRRRAARGGRHAPAARAALPERPRGYHRARRGVEIVLARSIEHSLKWSVQAWRDLSLDARVVGAVAVANWLLLFADHTTVAATRDVPLWQLFPPLADVAFLTVCGALAVTYVLRDRRAGAGFTTRDRA